MKSFEEVKGLKDELKPEYQSRHSDFAKLRHFYHGRYDLVAQEDTGGISSLFKDLRRTAQVGPDLNLVNNLLQEVVTRFQTYLSPLPMIRVYTDPPETPTRRAQATKKERYLYGLWTVGGMNSILNEAAWYLSLMGGCFLGAIPDVENNHVVPILRSPEHAFPVPSFDNRGFDGLIFCWEVGEKAVKRRYPNYSLKADRTAGTHKRGQASDNTVEYMEWYDGNEFSRWADGVKLNGVQHDFGFNLFDQMKFINVPGEMWGHGAVEQAVGMIEMGNALYSLMFQAVLENVFPRLILENPQKFPEEIDNGPGAVIGVNEGGKAYWLHPPTGLLGTQQSFLEQNQQAIKEQTFSPDVGRGQFNASIVTGKAINELQGAGTGSVVEMVQGVGIGSVLTGWNSRAIQIAQRMYADERIDLRGQITPSMTQISPDMYPLSLKGKELIGSSRNEVVFQPHMGAHEKLVMMLQAMQARLVSRKHAQENIGISDTTAMEEEIVGEQFADAITGFIVGSLDPNNPDASVDAANTYINTGEPPKPSQTPPSGLPPIAAPGPSVPGAAATAPAPPGLPEAAAPAPPAAGAGANIVPLDLAQSALQSLQGIVGKVFLVGEIVDREETDDAVEIAVTEPADRQTIKTGVQFEVAFTVVDGEPAEVFVEVTPGADPRPGGTEPDLAALAA